MPIVDPKEYIKPCKNSGNCRYIRLLKVGVENAMKHKDLPPGINFVVFDVEDINDFDPATRVKFKCCNSCGQPINHTEAIRLNGDIGFETKTVSESLAGLKALKERLKSNEGRTR